MNATTGWTYRQRADRAALLRDLAARLAVLAGSDDCPHARRAVLWRHSRDVGELADRVSGPGITRDDPAAAAGLAAELSGLGREAGGLGRELHGIAVRLATFYDAAGAGNPPGQGRESDTGGNTS